jgi:hypothetical protein
MAKCYYNNGCTYSQSFTATVGTSCNLKMKDTYGDGWNGNYWTGFGRTYTINSGLFVYDKEETFVVTDGMATSNVQCSGGTDQTQIGWMLKCTDGATGDSTQTEVASGDAFYNKDVTMVPGAQCTLYMEKYFGKDWLGTIWTGFGQTLTMTPSIAHHGSYFGYDLFENWNAAGLSITIVLWIKDLILFLGLEFFTLQSLIGNEHILDKYF